MTAVREQILSAVGTLLAAIPGVLEFERMPSGDPNKFNCLHLFDLGDRPQTGEAGTHRFDMSIVVEGYVAGGSGASASAASNALYAAVVETLFAEPQGIGLLGGLATEIEIDTFTPSAAERASTRRIAFSLALTITYATRRGSPQIID